ncbi:amidohydrolase [Mesorhizobium sp. BE184]|uniref:amidohydrolase n=1 Tax=Mesorhizobium sp. BE184 TaxID=2817714 RepID=UPI002864794F|nr:amidohydrolase [Mesorhizobium sp. BE184]MDR7033702.1 amidohydrolase [Mesorhizobium sp. BE184]
MAFLTNTDVVELTGWRRHLHQMPELSGEEAETAAEVEKFLSPTCPDLILSRLGGHGVALVYDGAAAGPTLLFRSELDALPIEELGDIGHKSRVPGKAHLCGHDGHMAILAAMARGLGRQKPRRGRVVLVFQPAEETGAGADAVIADRRYKEIAPDYAFSLHNLPGLPFGHVALKPGPVNCASRGMRIVLEGKTAHASMPETGTSPMAAISSLMPALTALSEGNVSSPAFTLVTVTHAEMGASAFGIAPARAEIWATLRSLVDDRMEALCAAAEALVTETAAKAGLRCSISYHEIFHHCENDAEATQHLREALDAEGVAHDEANLPIRASEDFGRFGDTAKSAMLFLGAGENHPALHNPDYDFPDDLIGIGARIFMRTVRNILG